MSAFKVVNKILPKGRTHKSSFEDSWSNLDNDDCSSLSLGLPTETERTPKGKKHKKFLGNASLSSLAHASFANLPLPRPIRLRKIQEGDPGQEGDNAAAPEGGNKEPASPKKNSKGRGMTVTDTTVADKDKKSFLSSPSKKSSILSPKSQKEKKGKEIPFSPDQLSRKTLSTEFSSASGSLQSSELLVLQLERPSLLAAPSFKITETAPIQFSTDLADLRASLNRRVSELTVLSEEFVISERPSLLPAPSARAVDVVAPSLLPAPTTRTSDSSLSLQSLDSTTEPIVGATSRGGRPSLPRGLSNFSAFGSEKPSLFTAPSFRITETAPIQFSPETAAIDWRSTTFTRQASDFSIFSSERPTLLAAPSFRITEEAPIQFSPDMNDVPVYYTKKHK